MSSHYPSPVLVVGGTGMLGPAVRTLARDGSLVLSVARRPERLGQVPGVMPVTGDWARPDDLAEAVAAAIAATGCGAPRGAITWVHSPHTAAVHTAIARLLTRDAVVVNLRGSAGRDPSHDAAHVPDAFAQPRRYRAVVLGFTDTAGGGTRWLTHREISDAALRALNDEEAVQIVGRISPWSDRP
ncbi:hypothetical protein [Haloechinothrix sp. LS1_15]|uniref:hypothetical protein n=1 Tax=Haloechinothrix sp. LS1_15 TaxID=2652248 RepID=UPI0029487572|nr:hypothetical protein [Haloechinothrix sp. LS1_15]MDV6011960.1 hypothetical protein [Haloechinothrix sp. LS1_15]